MSGGGAGKPDGTFKFTSSFKSLSKGMEKLDEAMEKVSEAFEGLSFEPGECSTIQDNDVTVILKNGEVEIRGKPKSIKLNGTEIKLS